MSVLDVMQNPNAIGVSTAATISINGNYIGVVQRLDPTQSRPTTAVRGVGQGDRILQRVWQNTEYKLVLTKFCLFKAYLTTVFGYAPSMRSLAQLRSPIDVTENLLLPDGSSSITTVYVGCYITDYSAPREIGGEIIITESVNMDCTFVSDGNAADSPFNYSNGLTFP